MLPWILAIGLPLLAAAALWVWYCRDPGPNNAARPTAGVTRAEEDH